MASECARNALLNRVVDNKTDSGIAFYFISPIMFVKKYHLSSLSD